MGTEIISGFGSALNIETLVAAAERRETPLKDNMIQMQAEHLSQTSAIPLTPEELSVKVLQPRPGYVRGLGMRPFSVNTTVAPVENSDYVQRLELQIAQQNEKIVRFKKSEKKQRKKIESIIECLRQKGITGNFESGKSSDSDGQAS